MGDVGYRHFVLGRKRTSPIALAVLVAGSMILMAAAPARARDLIRTDRNDTKGPLDLASVRVSSIRGGDRIAIRTLARFTAKQLDGSRGWFEVDFDTNADKDVEFWVVVFFDKHGIQAYQFRNKSYLRGLSARREDRRTISFAIPHRYLGHVHSYDFFVVSIWRASPCSSSKPCIDTIPDRYPLIRRDWTPPTVQWRRVPQRSTVVSNTLTFPVRFWVEDDEFGTGIDHWKLESLVDGGTWTSVESGRASGSITAQIAASEGATYHLRLTAVDKAGNKRTRGGVSTQVPYDDRNAALSYSSSTPVGRAAAFLGTITQLAQDETLTFQQTVSGGGSEFCLVGGPPVTSGQTASATVTLDGVPAASAPSETDSTADLSTVFCGAAGVGTHTWVVTATSVEPFVIDGVIADPGLA